MKKVRITPGRVKTTFLLPRKNFLVGMGSIFNLRGNYYSYNTSKTGIEADMKALENDWRMVGQDIMDAKRKFEKCH